MGDVTWRPGGRSRPLWDRFWVKVDAEGDCWLWQGHVGRNGYGQTRTNGQGRGFAHRVAWELLVGPIPAGLQLDHLCRVRNCVNPDHLEPVTQAENIRRGYPANAAIWQRAKTHCPQGHAYDSANTYNTPQGGRTCRTCGRIRAARKARREVTT